MSIPRCRKQGDFQLLMVFSMSLKLERAPEVKPEVPLKLMLLSFWLFFWRRILILNEILKPEVHFPNRKYLFKTGSSFLNHGF